MTKARQPVILYVLWSSECFGGEGRFDSICWCTVVASEHADDSASLEGLADRIVELTARTPMPLSIAYRTPDTLGADRLAAALGARHLAGYNRPLLVSDIGTAVTYDYVEGNRYVGGNIAPGIDLRLASFGCIYRRLASRVSPGGDIPLGARLQPRLMRSGAVRGIAAELAYYHPGGRP